MGKPREHVSATRRCNVFPNAFDGCGRENRFSFERPKPESWWRKYLPMFPRCPVPFLLPLLLRSLPAVTKYSYVCVLLQPLMLHQARLAQSAERKALNLVVVGSSPTVGVSPILALGSRNLVRRAQAFLGEVSHFLHAAPSALQTRFTNTGENMFF